LDCSNGLQNTATLTPPCCSPDTSHRPLGAHLVFGMDMLRDKIEQCICQRAMGPLTASAERSKNRAEVTGRELLL